jgi:hypothetical protein
MFHCHVLIKYDGWHLGVNFVVLGCQRRYSCDKQWRELGLQLLYSTVSTYLVSTFISSFSPSATILVSCAHSSPRLPLQLLYVNASLSHVPTKHVMVAPPLDKNGCVSRLAERGPLADDSE